MVVNHRIALQDSVQLVKDHYINLLTPWARKWNFNIHAFGADDPQDSSNHETSISLENNLDCGDLTLISHYELESSPVSDTDDARFRLLAGAIKGVFGEEVVVAPELLTGQLLLMMPCLPKNLTSPGNTDTRYYWELSPQIYRMSPWRASHDPRGSRMHTVDERMPAKGLIEMVKFYHEFIRILDEAQG